MKTGLNCFIDSFCAIRSCAACKCEDVRKADDNKNYAQG